MEVPNWVHQSQVLSKQFFEVHGLVAWILVGLIALHILAAMKHLFINKDKIFQRMWV
jgi:cytochrome b561